MGRNSVDQSTHDLSYKVGLNDCYGSLPIQDILQLSEVG